MFLHLRDLAEGEAFLVHCTAGKDRTGVFAALVLQLMGVGYEEIAEEYALTEVGLRDWKPIVVERLMREPALRADREGVENMISARRVCCHRKRVTW